MKTRDALIVAILGIVAFYVIQKQIGGGPTKASDSAPPSPSAATTSTTNSSRVEPFDRVPALLDKSRTGWIRVLGKPDRSSPPVSGVPPGGLDSWQAGAVEMIVTWTKDHRPLGIMFTAVKGSPELRIEEIGALVQKFPRFKPITSKGVLIIGINKD